MPRPKKKKPTAPGGWLAEYGLELVETLSIDEAEDWRGRWRRVYAVGTKRATGRWINGGYDWHTFSFEHAPALSKQAARAAYGELPSGRLLLVADGKTKAKEGSFIVQGPPPLLLYHDLLVFPPGLEWTMAFTHEDDWLGPYFSRREWVEAGRVLGEDPSTG